MIGAKPFHISLNKVHGFIGVYNGTRYLVLLDLERYAAIFNTHKYLVGVRSGIKYVFSYNYARIVVEL